MTSSFEGFLQDAGLQGEAIPDFVKALAESAAQAVETFFSMGQVLPGIPTAVDPVSGSGATGGPGSLLPPPAGGPVAAQLEGGIEANLSSHGIAGADAPGLAKALAASLAKTIEIFAGQTQVLPGIAVAGFVTTAPGSFQPVPLAGQLEPAVQDFLEQNNICGAQAPALARAVAQAGDEALSLFVDQVQVGPGIACPPGTSAAPGKFI
jgi:hypothetical protein